MLRDIQRSVVAMIIFTVITGGMYPVVVWAVAQAAFHHQAQGSLVTRNGVIIGSTVLAQGFTSTKYFHPRPSATSPAYNAASSGGSNLGPNSAALAKADGAYAQAVAKEDGISVSQVPVDLATASFSGLDPDISEQGALVQVNRIAAARHLSPAVVRALVISHLASPTLGFIGETRVNVLDLNLALDAMSR
jgi:potassium-transporting ATPase KdpC subunit